MFLLSIHITDRFNYMLLWPHTFTQNRRSVATMKEQMKWFIFRNKLSDWIVEIWMKFLHIEYFGQVAVLGLIWAICLGFHGQLFFEILGRFSESFHVFSDCLSWGDSAWRCAMCPRDLKDCPAHRDGQRGQNCEAKQTAYSNCWIIRTTE